MHPSLHHCLPSSTRQPESLLNPQTWPGFPKPFNLTTASPEVFRRPVSWPAHLSDSPSLSPAPDILISLQFLTRAKLPPVLGSLHLLCPYSGSFHPDRHAAAPFHLLGASFSVTSLEGPSRDTSSGNPTFPVAIFSSFHIIYLFVFLFIVCAPPTPLPD